MTVEGNGSSVIESVKDAFLKRLDDPFWFSLLTAFVVFNWEPLYFLVTRNAPIHRAVVFGHHGWTWDIAHPLLSAGLYTLVYPLFGGAFSVVRRWFQAGVADMIAQLAVWEVNAVKKRQYGERLTMVELHKHQEFQELSTITQAMLDEVAAAWAAARPGAGPNPLVEIKTDPMLKPPCFVQRLGTGGLAPLVQPTSKDRVLFAHKDVGPRHVLAFFAGSLVPWPSQYDVNDTIILLAGKVIVNPTTTEKQQADARIKMSQHQGWGFFEASPQGGFKTW